MDHTRHIGVFNAANYSVVLIGAGGIGALTGITLAKMGVGSLTIYDDDQVDPINLATQFYRLSDVGKDKVSALSGAVQEYAGLFTISKNNRVGQSTFLEPAQIVISAVDRIDARQAIWKAVQQSKPLWYLDARMSIEHFQLFTVDMNNRDWYSTALGSQDNSLIPNEPCTSKATIYTACIAAGQIGAAVRRIITGVQIPGVLSHDIFRNVLIEEKMQS